jgi:ketopantoate reductase
VTVGELADARTLLLECFREIAALARARGLELPVSLEQRLEAGIAIGNHKTSMLQDLEAGKPLEHACMTGALIEIAHHLGIDVPRIETLGTCIALRDAHAQHASRGAGDATAGANTPIGQGPADLLQTGLTHSPQCAVRE